MQSPLRNEIFKNNIPHLPEDASQVLSIDSATRIGINALPISGWKFAQWFGLPNPNDLRDPSPSLNQYSANINFIMNRCPKIEYAKFSGELGWAGVNSNVISNKRNLIKND